MYDKDVAQNVLLIYGKNVFKWYKIVFLYKTNRSESVLSTPPFPYGIRLTKHDKKQAWGMETELSLPHPLREKGYILTYILFYKNKQRNSNAVHFW